MTALSPPRARRVLGITGLAAAALLAYGGLARAEPEGSSVIRACVNPVTGDVRIPDPRRGGCHPFERALSWNARGPRGPQGPPGPAGLTRPSRTISEPGIIPAHSDDESIVVFCPDGAVPTGGGFEAVTNNVTVDASAPVVGPSGLLVGWRAAFDNPSADEGRGSVYVVCYTAPTT